MSQIRPLTEKGDSSHQIITTAENPPSKQLNKIEGDSHAYKWTFDAVWGPTWIDTITLKHELRVLVLMPARKPDREGHHSCLSF